MSESMEHDMIVHVAKTRPIFVATDVGVSD